MPLTLEELPKADKVGDPQADALVADLLDSGDVDGVNGLFRTIGTLSAAHPQLPPRLEAFLHEAAAPPPGWTADDVRRAEQFFAHHHGTASMMQGTVGLIGCYLSPAGAFTLRSTGRLGGQEGPGRRLSQSSRLFLDMGNKNALTDGSLAADVTKVRLVHASVRRLHKNSGQWDYEKWGEPVSQKYTGGAGFVFSTQVLECMAHLGLHVDPEDADGFLAAWHYVLHYLGTPEEWLLPKNAGEAREVWHAARDSEWQRSDDGIFMTRQALDFYRGYLPPGFHDAFVAMIRTALTDHYADLVDIPRSAFDLAAKPATTVSSIFGAAAGFGGDAAKPVAGVNPFEEVIGMANKAFNAVEHYALTHDQDNQPQMHAELHDGR
ncbi:oxygenase MpaB family protein [Streptomyces pinistramenti]|uniref:oxygenase MpaB family protein n=1 Tax=Streptomyces pinistramenti TaxID=2884812 RepID=UPI001D082987|nr:oxygenase MpaB family protein [Streptomyces pinistramenti]MCB5908309.1 DUF2236 domain-containing protein [Streptomyces pinistramenti]